MALMPSETIHVESSGAGGHSGGWVEGYCCLAELAIWEELRVRVSAVGVWGTRWGGFGGERARGLHRGSGDRQLMETMVWGAEVG